MASNLQTSTPDLNFGSVVTGTQASITVVLSNVPNDGSSDSVTLTDISIDNVVYSQSVIVPLTLDAGNATSFEVFFTGGTPGVTPQAYLSIASNDPGNPLVIPIESESIAPGVKAVSASPSSFMFANTKTGVDSAIQVFVVTNTGTVSVAVSGTTFPSGFLAAAPIPTYPATVAAGDSLSIGAKFHPSGQGYVNGDMEVASDAAASPLLIPLSGIGFLITPAYIATGEIVLLAAFGNTVLQFDQTDLDCEEAAFIKRDINLTAPGLEDSMLQMQLNHEAKGTSLLTMTVENQRAQAPTAAINLSTETNDRIRAAFGNLNSSLSGEVLTITLTHAADGGPAAISSYVLRHVPAGEVKPV